MRSCGRSETNQLYNIVQYSVLENKAANLVAAVLEQVLAIGKNTIICFLTTGTDLAGF